MAISKERPNLTVIKEYYDILKEVKNKFDLLQKTTQERDGIKKKYDEYREQRLDQFLKGFNIITKKLKELYQVITYKNFIFFVIVYYRWWKCGIGIRRFFGPFFGRDFVLCNATQKELESYKQLIRRRKSNS